MRVRVLAVACALASLSFSLAANAQTPDAQEVDTSYQTYGEGPFSLPLGVGLRIPRYDRVDGLALPWGPKISLASGRFEIDPTVTYRSHLGKFDPYARADIRLAPHDGVAVEGGTATFSNDEWIRSTIVNSLASFGVGSDARNYFRANRVTAELRHEFIKNGTTLIPRAGLLHEDAWSTGSAEPHTSAPWSIFGRTGERKMRRTNPSIARGHTTSAMAGANYDYDVNEMVVKLDGNLEHAFDSPEYMRGGKTTGNFTQLTLHGEAKFPTVGTQSFAFRGHGLLTPGDGAPPQRYGYLGGAGTLATVDLLALGGDRLVYVEGEYIVPLVKPILPFAGSPIIGLRYAAGSAGAGELPELIQNIGASIGVKFIKIEYHIDPNYKKTAFTRKHAFSVGLSLSM
ncbi:MAG TPA: hypothetical protein VM053_01330 [Gemmatimonadaceae bacterium]|nr:hypothetical protein [Gemmatimonadaceae bacterium]